MDKLKQAFAQQWETLISKVPDLIEGAVVMIIFVLLANLVNKLLTKRLAKKTENQLRARFIARVVKSAVILLGLMLAMKAAGYGEIAAGLVAGAGVSAFVIGFALKDIGENFLAGFILSFSSPFRIDDTIEIAGITGKVKALNLRDTHVKTADGKDVFIPNASLIKNNLQNYTLDGFMRHEFVLGVDYGTDFILARDTIEQVLRVHEGIAHAYADSSVSYDSLGASTYNIKVQYWKDMFDSQISGVVLKTELVENCLSALAAKNITMPGDIIELRPLPSFNPPNELQSNSGSKY